MANKERLSFDQQIAKKGEPATMVAARKTYDAVVASKPVTGDLTEWRDKKSKVANAMHAARQLEESRYYAEEIDDNVKRAEDMKKAAAEAKPLK